MAITVTSLTSGSSGEDVTSVTMAEFTLPANRLGLACVINVWGGSTVPEPAISGWSVVTSLLVEDVRRVTLFRRVSATPVTESPVITFGGVNQGRVAHSVSHCDENCVITGSGADGIVQALASGESHVGVPNATPTLDALAAFANVNNASFSCISIGFNADTASPGTGFTELSRSGIGGFSPIGTITQYKTTNDTVHELTGCTNSEDMFIGVAVELNHVAANSQGKAARLLI